MPDAREFALQNRVVLLRSDSGIPIDVALGAMPFEERATDRATDFVLQEGASLTTCSAEDLIVFKAFAGRHLLEWPALPLGRRARGRWGCVSARRH